MRRRTSGDRIRSAWVASAPMVRRSPCTAIARSASSPQRFRNRVSFSVPKLSETYRSVHPAIGTSGPSSRNIFNASVSDFGWRSERCEIGPGTGINRGARRARRENVLLWKTVHATFDSRLRQYRDVEIDDETDTLLRQLEIRQHLRFVHPVDLGYRLD